MTKKKFEPSAHGLRSVLADHCDDPTLLLVSDDDLAAAGRAVCARGTSFEDENFPEVLVRQLNSPVEPFEPVEDVPKAEDTPKSDPPWFGSTVHRLMFPSDAEPSSVTEPDGGTTRKDTEPDGGQDEDLLLWQEPDAVTSRLDELHGLLERRPEIAALLAKDLPTLIRSEDEFHWAGQHNGLLLAEALSVYQTAVPRLLDEYAAMALSQEDYRLSYEAGRFLDKAMELIRNCRDVIPYFAGRRVAESDRERIESFVESLRIKMNARSLYAQASTGDEDF